jgi:hypothetical protein
LRAQCIIVSQRDASLALSLGLSLSATLEELDRPLVLLRGCSRPEGAEVASLAGPGVWHARIQSILTGSELANHDRASDADSADDVAF